MTIVKLLRTASPLPLAHEVHSVYKLLYGSLSLSSWRTHKAQHIHTYNVVIQGAKMWLFITILSFLVKVDEMDIQYVVYNTSCIF